MSGTQLAARSALWACSLDSVQKSGGRIGTADNYCAPDVGCWRLLLSEGQTGPARKTKDATTRRSGFVLFAQMPREHVTVD